MSNRDGNENVGTSTVDVIVPENIPTITFSVPSGTAPTQFGTINMAGFAKTNFLIVVGTNTQPTIKLTYPKNIPGNMIPNPHASVSAHAYGFLDGVLLACAASFVNQNQIDLSFYAPITAGALYGIEVFIHPMV